MADPLFVLFFVLSASGISIVRVVSCNFGIRQVHDPKLQRHYDKGTDGNNSKGLFARRKILEGRTNLPWVYKQKFWSMSCPSREGLRRNLKMVGVKNKNTIWALLLSLWL